MVKTDRDVLRRGLRPGQNWRRRLALSTAQQRARAAGGSVAVGYDRDEKLPSLKAVKAESS